MAIKRFKKGRYMMATKAQHQLGDISSDEPDLCVIYGEDETNYIGSWVMGFGFIDVKFPKKTTRELTEGEKARYNGSKLKVGSQIQTINIK